MVYINLPHSAFINWLKKNKPELLQPTDKPISVGDILLWAEHKGWGENPLTLYGLQIYGIDIPGNQYIEMILAREANLEKFYDAWFAFQQQQLKSQEVPAEEQKED
jgi:hypothetical protein